MLLILFIGPIHRLTPLLAALLPFSPSPVLVTSGLCATVTLSPRGVCAEISYLPSTPSLAFLVCGTTYHPKSTVLFFHSLLVLTPSPSLSLCHATQPSVTLSDIPVPIPYDGTPRVLFKQACRNCGHVNLACTFLVRNTTSHSNYCSS